MTITSSVNKGSTLSSTLRVSVPKAVKEVMGLNDKDRVEWSFNLIDGEWVAFFKKKRD